MGNLYSIILWITAVELSNGLDFSLGSLSNDYDDNDRWQRQKTIGFMSKTTALHVHHAF